MTFPMFNYPFYSFLWLKVIPFAPAKTMLYALPIHSIRNKTLFSYMCWSKADFKAWWNVYFSRRQNPIFTWIIIHHLMTVCKCSLFTRTVSIDFILPYPFLPISLLPFPFFSSLPLPVPPYSLSSLLCPILYTPLLSSPLLS